MSALGFFPVVGHGRINNELVSDDDDVELDVLECHLTYKGQTVTTCVHGIILLYVHRNHKDSLGRKAQDGHHDFHTQLLNSE